jgi:hypothetical protein
MALQNLLSPVILFFFLGIAAGLSRSSLSIPPGLSKSVSLYLMMAIGFRGGVEIAHTGLTPAIAWSVLGAVTLGALLPFVAYALLRGTTGLDRVNAASVSAHYGSVSVVTFAAAIAALTALDVPFEPYIITLLAVMEAPAILTGLLLAGGGSKADGGGAARFDAALVRHILLHGSVVLLLGSFMVGWISGPAGLADLSPVFVAPFKGVLCVFMLDMGLLVAQRFADLRALNVRLAAFGLYMPLVGAAAALGLAWLLGLSPGGATALAVLGASASYIVVPAVMRGALPGASPALALALSLGITFPFNLVVGIPLYHAAATRLIPDTAVEPLGPPPALPEPGPIVAHDDSARDAGSPTAPSPDPTH